MQIATFELRVQAIDHPSERRRWNGGPMASEEAAKALTEAVDAFKAVLRNYDLGVIHAGYGVTASELEED